MYRLAFKRLLDIVVSLVMLFALLPLLIALALLVRVTMGSPVLFRQMRPGRHGVPFNILKFRTMRVATHEAESPQERLTATGRWLRYTSLDELPELLNVLKGDMSLIGPRPLLMQYLGLYSPEQARRHEVRPGITGLAQISGRNALSWERRFALDGEYVDCCSFALDAKITFKTFAVVLKQRGVSEPIAEEQFSG